MTAASHIAVRLLLLLLTALAGFLVDVSVAQAQSEACSRLTSNLSTLERNRDLRNLEGNSRRQRSLADDLQQAESRYVRQGCNADARAGRQLNGQCRALARDIISGRKEAEELSRAVDTGNAVAEQRESILQQVARFDCRVRSRGYDDGEEMASTRRGNIFERLFGMIEEDDGQDFRGEEFEGYGSYHTVRTVCVRKADGYFWPISYSTLVEYVPNDADQCQVECPGTEVDLYYYDNPGQEPEQMVNQYGEPYASLPTAFKYRTAFDRTISCKPPVDYGTIALTAGDGGQSRATITYGGVSFPMPLRDPRAQQQPELAAPTQVAELVDVPLPRRRPAAPGETPAPAPATPAPAVAQQQGHVVEVGGKRVRVVGPVTPYAPGAAAGT